MNPTSEQLACVDGAKENDILKIESCAGSGKTSTLILTANAVKIPSLYLAFNKGTAEEGRTKFPPHVACRTTHSVAFSAFGADLQHKLNRPRGAYVNVAGTGGEIARFFKLSGVEDVCTPAAVGLFVKRTVESFEQSADATLGLQHTPAKDMAKAVKADRWIQRSVVACAQKLWKERTNRKSVAMASHDTYLKLYQLSKPILDEYKVLYLDEAQDTNDCVLDIVLRQRDHGMKIVLVGDARQAIYGWRGARNAMQQTQAPVRYLSQSFRYGDAVAKIATDVLKGKMEIRGNPDIASIVGVGVVDVTKAHTRIYRTNGALLTDATNLLEQGLEVAIEIDTHDFTKKLQSAVALFEKDLKAVKHEDIVPYLSWGALEAEAKHGGELKRLAAIVRDGRAERIIDLLQSYVRPAEPLVICTSAHKAKGKEWDQVMLADDFPSHFNEKGVWIGLDEPEENLLYVACTRAKLALDVNPSVVEALDYSKTGVGRSVMSHITRDDMVEESEGAM